MGSGVPGTWVPADIHQISENLGTDGHWLSASLKIVGTEEYRVPAKKIFWVPMDTGYRPNKKFWVPMGTGKIFSYADP